jgi:Ca2+-binding EF-hand superfamily protein
VTALLLITLAALPAGGHEILIRQGESIHRLVLEIDTAEGSLAARETKLLAGWKPSSDGSDPLDRLLPDGRLLRVEVLPASPYPERITRALFAALDRNGDGRLTPDELKDADRILLARFDADEDGCLVPLGIVPDLLTAKSKSALTTDLSVTVNHPGEAPPAGITGRSRLAARVKVAEAKREILRDKGFLFDLASSLPQPGDLPALPRALRRSGREKDRKRFEEVAGAVVTLTIRPQVRGWFEILDTDGDGQLSTRELRAAWDRLADDAARKAGFLTLPDFSAPVVSLTISPGVSPRPAVVLVKKPRPPRGPAWFQAMDRNGDGDVSRAEFLGTDEEFRAYDTDGDGLISVREAEAGDRKRKEGRRP